MILNKENYNRITDKKVTFIKGFTHPTAEYDFNKLSQLSNDYSLLVHSFSINPSETVVFKSTWQMRSVHNIENYFFTFFDFFYKTFKYVPSVKDGVDLFFSFVTNVGESHEDNEDVFLIGLHGISTYRIIETNQTYELESGDLLYIPKGIRHNPVSITPRIIASLGYYGERLK